MKRKLTLFAVVILFFTEPVFALDPIPQDSGFSGFLRAGAGVLKYKSNLVAGNDFMDVGNDTINNLNDGADAETSGMGLINFELAYTFSATRTQFTFGSQIEDIAQMQLGQQLAVKQELPDNSILMAGFVFSGIPTDVWEDPYVTGISRRETDRNSMGGRLVYDRILGSDFEFRYTFRNIDIDNEASGTALGLSADQMQLLRREGTDHRFELSYRFNARQRHLFIPSLTYMINDRDGDAMSYDGVDFQLTYIFFNDPVTLITNGRIGRADYDETNPIYGKTQDDEWFGADIQIYYKNPFGWKPFGLNDFSLFVMGSYLKSDANIDFYDTEVSIAATGMMIRF